MRPTIALAAAVLTSLAGASESGAATFRVAVVPSAEPTSCADTTPGRAFDTIAEALACSRADAAPDVIDIGPGVFNEAIRLDQPADDRLVVRGSGRDGLTATVLDAPAGNGAATVSIFTSVPLVVEGLVIRTRGSDTRQPLQVSGPATVRDVTVDLEVPGQGTTAVSVGAGATLREALVRSTSNASAVVAASIDAQKPAVIERTTVQTSGSDKFGYALTVAGHLRVDRSRLHAHTDAERTISAGSQLLRMVLRSSLVTGSMFAPVTLVSNGATDGELAIEHSTIGAPASAGQPSVQTSTSGAGRAVVTARGSILLSRAFVQGEQSSVTCTDTTFAFPSQAAGEAPGCNGTLAGNAIATPSALFADAASGDLRLRPGSPAVDVSTTPLAAGTRDLAGTTRGIDGTNDCVAAPDRGAFELTGRQGTPPVVQASGPDSATTGTPATFTASGDEATYTWAFSDGGAATGASVERTFATPGTVTATVTATKAGGCKATSAVAVDVRAPAPPPATTTTPTTTTPTTTATTTTPATTTPSTPSAVTTTSGGPTTPVTPVTPTATADRLAPTVSGVRLAKAFRSRAVRRGRRTLRAGTTLRLRLSEASTLRLAVARVVRRKVRPVGTLRATAKAGAATVRLSGRVAGRRLKRGTYRLTITATDTAGNRSRPVVRRFRIS